MAIDYSFHVSTRKEVKDFIEKHHYSRSINGISSTFCFSLKDGENIVGAMIFGNLAMANQWKKYGEKRDDVLELRRLVLIDNTPKNSESFFISRALKYLIKNTSVKTIVSYADVNYGHVGTVYKASNFTFKGKTSPGRVINWNGKRYHDKSIRNSYKGEIKPFSLKIKQALENGEAYYEKQLPKNIYVYDLNSRRKNRREN